MTWQGVSRPIPGNALKPCLKLQYAPKSAYFRKTDAGLQLPTWFVFQNPQETSLFYGFPEVDWSYPGYIRVAPDIPDRILKDPGKRTGVPDPKGPEGPECRRRS